ncbi:MAG: T9SS type A sorting domain-containing protein [Lentimicrobium sp.]|nr:T9SS type A sorting domain-containing protein [Lentimicrobium sp.]
MKNLMIALCFAPFLLLDIKSIDAQNYRVFDPENVALYKDNFSRAYCMKVDSIATSGQDTIYFLFKNLQEVGYDCFHLEGPSWMGNQLKIKPNGENIFYNGRNEEIIIKTDALENESWLMYSTPSLRFIAKVDSIRFHDILGVLDSVKYISLQAQNSNNQNINHFVNNKKIGLSKNFGLIKPLSFYNFPDIDFGFLFDQVEELELAGIDNSPMGLQLLHWHEVHDHEPGDELHISSMFYSYSPLRRENLIKKLLSKTISADTIYNTWERTQSVILSGQWGYNVTSFIDTITERIVPYPDFETLPGQYFRIGHSGDTYNTTTMRETPDFICKQMGTSLGSIWDFTWLYDTCYIRTPDGGSYPHNNYYAGLGGSYYECIDWPLQSYKRLVYYKKNGVEWGNPLDIAVNTHHIGTINPSSQFELYPNPVSDILFIKSGFCVAPAEAVIRDKFGREVMRFVIQNELESINISHLTPGLYIIRLGYGNQVFSGKIIRL